MEITLGQQYNVGEKPTVILYKLTLNAMQGHQKNINNTPETMLYTIRHGSSNIHYKGYKYKATSWHFASFFVFMLSLKPRPFVQSSFDMQAFR